MPHLLIRLTAFPILFGILYWSTKNMETGIFAGEKGIRVAFFGSAALVALTLMSETILLFGKKQLPQFFCNIAVIFIIILSVIILAPGLF